jgi:Xaa-Pro aminopeptidase
MASLYIFIECFEELSLQDRITKRIQKLRQTLAEKKIDAFLVLIDHNRRYLSGFTAEDTLFDESAGALFIGSENLLLATDSRYELQAAKEAPQYEIFCYQKGLVSSLPTILPKIKARTLGYEHHRLSVKQYEEIITCLKTEHVDIELIGLDGMVERQREIKDQSEIDKTKAALVLAENVFTQVIAELQPGLPEIEIAWAMEKGMRAAGAEALSFPPIVASGPNSAMPHAVPSDRCLQVGEPILFDWGARLNGYCSDISRTLIFGQPDSQFKKVYQTVKDAQSKAIDAIRAGVHAQSVDRVAREHIEAAGFKDRFGHGLGHGTGLAIHEPPRLSPLLDTILEEGMLCTVEPGVYLPSWGGVRLENMVVVRRDHAEVLNTLGLDNHVLSAIG